MIYFEIDDQEEHFSFGTYALAMYYAKQINSVYGKILFDATSTEHGYRVDYDIPVDDLTYDDLDAHFNIDDLQLAITFIEDQLIPALNNETQDLLEKFGGAANFHFLYDSDTSFLSNISIYENEFYDSDAKQMAFSLNRLKNLFQYSLSIGQAYTVYIH